jgi:hypothetical protein
MLHFEYLFFSFSALSTQLSEKFSIISVGSTIPSLVSFQGHGVDFNIFMELVYVIFKSTHTKRNREPSNDDNQSDFTT